MGSYTDRTDSYMRTAARRTPSVTSEFSMSYIISDPFFLSTISISIIGWIIAFVGSIFVDVSGSFPTLTWWGIVFEFFLIAGVVYCVGADAFYSYRVALCAFLATATVYTTNSTNNFVWASSSTSGPSNTGTTAARGAVAAGHILLSIINILWIFYFGTAEDETVHEFIDSFGLNKELRAARLDSMRRSNPFSAGRPMDKNSLARPIDMQYRIGEGVGSGVVGNRMSVRAPSGVAGGSEGASSHPQMFTSAQLGGFENSSEHGNNLLGSRNASYISRSSGTTGMRSSLHAPTDYPYRARAVYSYNANPEDDNEISFAKGEVLEISDVTGRWWQARRVNGEVGICPSNYMMLES